MVVEALVRMVEHLNNEALFHHYQACLASDDRASWDHVVLEVDQIIEWLEEKGIEHKGRHSLDEDDVTVPFSADLDEFVAELAAQQSPR